MGERSWSLEGCQKDVREESCGAARNARQLARSSPRDPRPAPHRRPALPSRRCHPLPPRSGPLSPSPSCQGRDPCSEPPAPWGVGAHSSKRYWRRTSAPARPRRLFDAACLWWHSYGRSGDKDASGRITGSRRCSTRGEAQGNVRGACCGAVTVRKFCGSSAGEASGEATGEIRRGTV